MNLSIGIDHKRSPAAGGGVRNRDKITPLRRDKTPSLPRYADDKTPVEIPKVIKLSALRYRISVKGA